MSSAQASPSASTLSPAEAVSRYRDFMNRLKGRYQQRRPTTAPPVGQQVRKLETLKPIAPAAPITRPMQHPVRPVGDPQPAPKPRFTPRAPTGPTPAAPPMSSASEGPYNAKWTKADLYEEAKELGIKGRSNLNKAQLIEVLNAHARKRVV